ALATDPKLLLLDEVMAGLRPNETDRMVAILKQLNRDTGMTILLIEHVMRAVVALASRLLVLHHGATIAQGAPEAVVRDPAVIASYLGAAAAGRGSRRPISTSSTAMRRRWTASASMWRKARSSPSWERTAPAKAR